MVRYSISRCFHLLSIFMVDCSKMLFYKGENCCQLEFQDTSTLVDGQNFKANVFFYPNTIKYVFNDFSHTVFDLQIVHYLYYLMGLTQEQWMHEVLKVVQKSPRTLLQQAKMATVGHCPGEASLRRFITPPVTLLQEIMKNGRVMSVEQYKDYFMDINAETRSIFETIWNCGRERETLYMQEFHFFGIYSNDMHRTSLSYLMALESILRKDLTWEEVHPQSYMCQVEAFHMVFWRSGWPHRKCFAIYLDFHLGDLLDVGCSQHTLNVLGPNSLSMGAAETHFHFWFIMKNMFRKIPFHMPSLRSLARFQLALNVFMKRLFIFSQFPLTPMEVDDTSLVENTKEFKDQMAQVQQYLLQWAEGTPHMVTLEDIDFIWHKAHLLPLEVMLNIYQNYEGYSTWAEVIGYRKLIQLEQIFTPI